MKHLIALLMVAATTTAMAAPEATDKDKMQDAMFEQGISYIWNGTAGTIAVLHDVDPRSVCELADKYPAAGVVKVVNYGKQTTARCELPK